MTSSNPKIITLEEGWNEEIKKKVSFTVSAGALLDQQGTGAGMHFLVPRDGREMNKRMVVGRPLAGAVAFFLLVCMLWLLSLCGSWCRPPVFEEQKFGGR